MVEMPPVVCSEAEMPTQLIYQKGWAMGKCEKCFRALAECQGCRGGRSNLTCSKCNNTGRVCMEHGGHWKR